MSLNAGSGEWSRVAATTTSHASPFISTPDNSIIFLELTFRKRNIKMTASVLLRARERRFLEDINQHMF
ncbi:hypothetical protein SKAU_G00259390 [Synaphobranchus kaupii]|uniref:Uncharacterized protein n=1 Tax=Synaphobranchus kaupii TaxID=118154 RepID=A0A9Q1IQK8_SYNKA|nr:hypothetical protein SKAU_G00259390 [Synaphobranchus kaupii]